MPIHTKQVAGRRRVRYESLHDLLADAQRMPESEVRTLGNWSQGQIYLPVEKCRRGILQPRQVQSEALHGSQNSDSRRYSVIASVRSHSPSNHSTGCYEHIARSLNASIDGVDFSLPAPLRWVMSLLMKRKFLKKEIPAGFKTTDAFMPEETTVEAGLASLQRAIARQEQESRRVPHPAFGNIRREEWNDFHLRHAEMHMSFLVNDDRAAS